VDTSNLSTWGDNMIYLPLPKFHFHINSLCKKVEFERAGNSASTREDEILNIHAAEAQKLIDRDPKLANSMNHGNK